MESPEHVEKKSVQPIFEWVTFLWNMVHFRFDVYEEEKVRTLTVGFFKSFICCILETGVNTYTMQNRHKLNKYINNEKL